MKLLLELHREQLDSFKQEPERAAKLVVVGERKKDAAASEIELAAMTAVCQCIMNLDASVWKR